mmetsp:Transcript_25708/g.59986  ORF Transcript_25708/g.59986 Transcript_25708/m.59986 type:complete len:91 (-) Transcript_25708:176-448(-)
MRRWWASALSLCASWEALSISKRLFDESFATPRLAMRTPRLLAHASDPEPHVGERVSASHRPPGLPELRRLPAGDAQAVGSGASDAGCWR